MKPMTKADQRYYAAERRQEAQRKCTKKFIENRKRAYFQWKKDHPEGVTATTLKDFQAFMRKADHAFKKST